MPAHLGIKLPDRLEWIPGAVENQMYRNGFESRNALVEAGVLTRRQAYQSFDDNWAGEATGPVVARIAALLRVRMSDLVVEPATQMTQATAAARKARR